MSEVTIRMRPSGPFVVEGPFKLVDSRGQEFETPAGKPAIALCRCGQSSSSFLRRHPQNLRVCIG